MFDIVWGNFNLNKKTIFFFCDALSAGAFLFLMAYGFSRPLVSFVGLFTGNSIIVITVYFFLFYVLYFIFTLPLKYYQGLDYIKEHSFIEWFRLISKKETSVFFVLFFIIHVIYFFLQTDVVWWWLPVAFLCIISRYSIELIPKYLLPLFLTATAVDASEFKTRLIELADKAHMKISDVFFMSNARTEVVIIGQGNSRKLMLSEKIMSYAHEEIEILVAREAAYHYYGIIRAKLVIEALVMLLSFFIVNVAFKPAAAYFGFEFISDIETLPVFLGLFFIVFLMMSMIQNYYLRAMDGQADIYALKMTQAPDAFISLLIRQQNNNAKMALDYFISQILNINVSDAKRISLAQDYAQGLALREKGRAKI